MLFSCTINIYSVKAHLYVILVTVCISVLSDVMLLRCITKIILCMLFAMGKIFYTKNVYTTNLKWIIVLEFFSGKNWIIYVHVFLL